MTARIVGVAAVAALVSAVTAPQAFAGLPPGTQCQLAPTKTVVERPWAQQRLDFERVWPLTRGTGVTVAVVDTGVDANHPQLRGHVAGGQDVKNGGTADTDCVGHGTLVAGIIGAAPVPGVGFAGVAPGVTIFPVREANTTTDGTTGDLADAINAAVVSGARVINVSIVSNDDSTAVAGAVRAALAHDVVVIAAAGNDFKQGNPTEYPAAYPGVLAVGAVGPNDQRASFSETESNVGVAAPGTDIVGPGAGGPGLVAAQSGTSYAAPYVSGVAALVRAYHPELTAQQVVHRVEVTADHPGVATLPDPQLGWGVVDPYAAVTAVLPEEYRRAAPPAPAAALSVPTRPAADTLPTTIAVGAAVGGVALAGLVLVALAVTRSGRRRGWRPGHW